MTLRIGIQVIILAFIGMVFVADCHPFSCLFNNCKCGFDFWQQVFNHFVCFLFIPRPYLNIKRFNHSVCFENLLCPNTLFKHICIDYVGMPISSFLTIQKYSIFCLRKNNLNWANVPWPKTLFWKKFVFRRYDGVPYDLFIV
jgi:hypothetical protein